MTASDAAPTTAPSDATVYVDGQAYDVRRYANAHPGGAILLRFLGKDATAVFAAFHGKKGRDALKGLRQRARDAEAPTPESATSVEQAFEALRERSLREGLYEARPAWYALRGAAIFALIGAAAATLAFAPAYWPLAGLALGLAWQQNGWFAHDVLHHSMFADRRRGELFGVFMGCLVLGFSADWWKKKHNTHHALPNVLGVDEDIDTLPFLAFDERDLERASGLSRFLVRFQLLTAIPVVSFARLNWCAQSALWALRAPNVPDRGLELAAIALHWVWSLALLALLPSWELRLAFFALAQLSSGLLVGSVFIVGHNARPILDRGDSPGFYALQCLTTQNVAAPFGTRWFFGGLDRQIEHHLFPTMPRHHHDAVADGVRAICTAHGVPYTQRGFFEGLVDVGRVLARVGKAQAPSSQRPSASPLSDPTTTVTP